MVFKKIATYFNKNDDVIKTLNKLLMFNTKKLKVKGFIDYKDEDFIDFIKKITYDINSLYEFFTLFDLTCIGKEVDNKDIIYWWWRRIKWDVFYTWKKKS